MKEGLNQFLSEETDLICKGVGLFKGFEDKRHISVYAGDYTPKANESCDSCEMYEFCGSCKSCMSLFEEINIGRCKDSYLFMQRDIKNWLRVVLMLDMLNNRKESSSAVIYLPGQNLKVSVGTSIESIEPKYMKPFEYDRDLWEWLYTDVANLCRDLPYFEEHKEDDIKTPIGIMNGFVLKAVLGVEPNPIIGTYEVLSNLNKQIHNLLSEQGVADNVILNDELLAEYKIKDVLGVHVFDTLYPTIEKFLNIPRGSTERS